MAFRLRLVEDDRNPFGKFESAVRDWRAGDPLMLAPGRPIRIVEVEHLEDAGDDWPGVFVLATG